MNGRRARPLPQAVLTPELYFSGTPHSTNFNRASLSRQTSQTLRALDSRSITLSTLMIQ